MVRLLDRHHLSTNPGRRVIEEFVVHLGITCGDELEDLLRQACRLNATDLAEGICRSLDIPEDAPGGATLDHAFGYLKLARLAESRYEGLRDDLYVLAATAAQIAGEAAVEASRANRWPQPGEPNHVCTVLGAAYAFAARTASHSG